MFHPSMSPARRIAVVCLSLVCLIGVSAQAADYIFVPGGAND